MSHAATVEIVTRSERRRWSSEEKLRIVRETLERGASVGMVARRHGLAPNLLYTWRRVALSGALAGFVPVELAKGALPSPGLSSGTSALAPGASSAATRDELRRGEIEIVLMNGWRVRVGAGTDAATLQRVFEALGACG